MANRSTVKRTSSGFLTDLPESVVTCCQKPRRSGFYNRSHPVRTNRNRTIRISSQVLVCWRSTNDYGDCDPDELDAPCIINLEADVRRSTSERIGYFRGHVLPADSHSWDEHSFFVACDSRSQTLCDLAVSLLGTGEPLHDFCGGDIFFADALEILSPWRRNKLGIKSLKSMIQLASEKFGAAICCFKPYPLQFQGWQERANGLQDASKAFDAALKRLAGYYALHLGAQPIPNSKEFYFVRMNE